MVKLYLREKYIINCGGMVRSSREKNSLQKKIKVEIEIYQNHKTKPTCLDSSIPCPHFAENKKCLVSIDDTVKDAPKGKGNCKKYISFMETKKSAFTLSDYNDQLKLCLKKSCTGLVLPTWNANVGECYKCGNKVSWDKYSS